MNDKLTLSIKLEACRIGVEAEALKAFVEVESGSRGFNNNGKLVILFEPKYFFERTKVMISNGIQGLTMEWLAFNEAFNIDPNAAMESTSIGLGQVMGANWKRLGYKNVGAMWNDAKEGEDKQLFQMTEFIRTDPTLLRALKDKKWHTVASRYNGAGYKKLAIRLKRVPYDQSMKAAYEKYKKQGI